MTPFHPQHSGRRLRKQPPSAPPQYRRLHPSWLPLLLFGSFLQTGCQTSGYRAAGLPPQFRAAAPRQEETIDLARVTAPGASEAMLAPGDLLEVTIATGRQDEKATPIIARVADDGTIALPVIGPVPVAGSEAFDASQNIAYVAVERGMYRHPVVTVEIKTKAVNRVTVLGAVNEPGVHELPRAGSDLVTALAAAGGLSDEAGAEIEIIRQPKFASATRLATAEFSPPSEPHTTETSAIELAAYQNVGQATRGKPGIDHAGGWTVARRVKLDLRDQASLARVDFHVGDRDVIHVLPRKPEVIHVTGLVNKPGQFELEATQDIHLLDALAMAGGRGSPVADKVIILRRTENRTEPLLIHASIAKAKKNGMENLRLTDGDTVSVEQTPATIAVDAISRFFRISFGMATRTVF